jgi:hypothetical protein
MKVYSRFVRNMNPAQRAHQLQTITNKGLK